MKTIVVPTDFSEPANNAAFYALHLAHAMNCKINLCHAFDLPSENPVFRQTAWALYDYPALQNENSKELKMLIESLKDKEKSLWEDEAFAFYPPMFFTCEGGEVIQVIKDTAAGNETSLIVMGMQGAGMLVRFILGSNSIRMIKNTEHPLLLIPPKHKYTGLKKIAFATDLQKKDVKVVQSLLKFAEYFDAELLITHVIQSNNDIIEGEDYEFKKQEFLRQFDGEFVYKCIYSENIDYGLDILKNKDIDMLIMGHRFRGLFESLIEGGYAVRQAGKLKVPLLIIPEGKNI